MIVVFLPLFGMTGIEGRMYQPLAAAVIAAMIAALVLALTLVPIAAAMVLRPSRPGTDEDVLSRKVKQWYAPLLDRCLRHPRLVALVTLLVAVPAIALGFASAVTSCRNWMRGRSFCRPCFPPRPHSRKSIA